MNNNPRERIPLELRDVSYRVGEKKPVDNVSHRFAPTKGSLIVGANGAGKTLLMRICHGLIKPSEGVVASRPPTSETAMAFQTPIPLRRSVADNAEFPLKVRGVPRAMRKELVRERLAEAGLKTLAEQSAENLSGGELQRLSIARAAICNPTLIFLDEPTANLDPAGTLAVEALVRRIARRGAKIVMTTHDRDQMKRIADLFAETLFLHNGRLAEVAEPETFLAAPKSPHAKAYMRGELIP